MSTLPQGSVISWLYRLFRLQSTRFVHMWFKSDRTHRQTRLMEAGTWKPDSLRRSGRRAIHLIQGKSRHPRAYIDVDLHTLYLRMLM